MRARWLVYMENQTHGGEQYPELGSAAFYPERRDWMNNRSFPVRTFFRSLVWLVAAGLLTVAAPHSIAKPTADYNQDGLFTVPDVQCAILVTLWILGGNGGAPVCLAISLDDADTNADKLVNVADILVVIASVLNGVDLAIDVGEAGDTVYAVQKGEVAVGQTVHLTGLVVTGVAHHPNGDGYGLFVQDPLGGPYSGIWVYTKAGAQNYGRGKEVTVEGPVTEFDNYGKWPDSVTEIEVSQNGMAVGSVVVTGVAVEPEPVVLEPAAFDEPTALEPYEGVLVRLNNVTVEDPDLGFGEWSLEGGVVVDDKLFFNPPVAAGATFESIVGVLDYAFGTYRVLPRDSADLVGYQASAISVANAKPGDLVVSEIMIDPGLGCADVDDEWVEIFNASGSPMDLNGLVLSWSTSNKTITGPLLVPAGGYVVGVRQNPPPCYNFTGDFTFTFGLTNTGKVMALKRPDGVILDQVDFTDWPLIQSGKAIGLDVGHLNATDNDFIANWCHQKTSITVDFGTPKGANDPCFFVPPDPVLELKEGDCKTVADCVPPEKCWGIPNDGATDLGRCVDIQAVPNGAGNTCTASMPCGPDLVCVGLSKWEQGFCNPAWMEGIYTNSNPVTIPSGATVTHTIPVYGLATVPVDIWVTLKLAYPKANALFVTLTDPNGDVAVVWNVGEGVDSVSTTVVSGISGDDAVNGLWTLTIQGTPISTGVLYMTQLKITSNWD